VSTRIRRRWTAEEKWRIIEEARKTELSVSEVCRRYGLATTQFYSWEKQARQGALAALREGNQGRKKSDPTVLLQAEIERLRAVIAELSTENLALKKGRWP
jgi:transposase